MKNDAKIRQIDRSIRDLNKVKKLNLFDFKSQDKIIARDKLKNK